MSTAPPLLKVEALTVQFANQAVVENLSFAVNSGEMIALVGESGSGKSQTLLSILALVDESGQVKGSIRFDDRELVGASEKSMRKFRGSEIALVFQDPLSALNPGFTIGWQIEEPLRMQRPDLSRSQRRARVLEVMAEMGLPDPPRLLRHYPHEFSGGMRQRVLLACALADRPRLLLADEPTTALDVTIAAEILDLLDHLRQSRGLGIVFVSHDLNLVASRCDRVVVMYRGRMVETGSRDQIFSRPAHPYTQMLLEASVDPFGEGVQDVGRALVVPSIRTMTETDVCVFADRCAYAIDDCLLGQPPLDDVGGGHLVACIRVNELGL